MYLLTEKWAVVCKGTDDGEKVAVVTDYGYEIFTLPAIPDLDLSRKELAEQLVADHNYALAMRSAMEDLQGALGFMDQCRAHPEEASLTGAMRDAKEWRDKSILQAVTIHRGS